MPTVIVVSEPRLAAAAVASLEFAVECSGVAKAFGRVVALSGVDLAVRPGRVHGVLGPNGAGKTTLLRILFGLVRPDAGMVRVLGVVPGHGAGRSLDGVAGFVESPRFHPYLTVGRTLDLLAALDSGDAGTRTASALEAVGLGAVAGRKVGRLSTGQRQRLGLAAALLRDPQVLVVDEPTTGLDPGGIQELYELVGDLAATGRTVLMSSHDMTEVERLCDDVTILAAGSVVHDGSVAELQQRSSAATHRLRTSDDAAAERIAKRCRDVDVLPDGQGALTAHGDTAAVDVLVLTLAAAGVAVRELVRTESALQAEFTRLVAQ